MKKYNITIPKILMLIGSGLLIIFSILYMAKVVNSNLYGWTEGGVYLTIIGIIYIAIPFSVRPGNWSRIWAIAITTLSVLMIIGGFVGKNVNFRDVWTYINILPYLFMTIGAFLWIFDTK